MSEQKQSPFVAGAKVAIRDGHYDIGFSAAKVAKVYKSGRFVLEGSVQQWRPYRYGTADPWRASPTGDHYTRRSLLIWDASTDAEIAKGIADKTRHSRWAALRKRVETMHPDNVTDAMCDALEALLPPKETKVSA